MAELIEGAYVRIGADLSELAAGLNSIEGHLGSLSAYKAEATLGVPVNLTAFAIAMGLVIGESEKARTFAAAAKEK